MIGQKLETLESGLVNTLRRLVGVIAILLLVLVVGVLGYGIFVKYVWSELPPFVEFNPPSWKSIRTEILPLPQLVSETKPLRETQEREIVSNVAIDPRIEQTLASFDSMYERDSAWSYTQMVPPRRFNEWIQTSLTISETERNQFFTTLPLFAAEVARDPVLDRFGDDTDRMNAINEALTAFVSQYQSSLLASVQEANQQKMMQEVAADVLFDRTFYISAVLLGAFLALLLLLVFLRIEHHMKSIASDVRQ